MYQMLISPQSVLVTSLIVLNVCKSTECTCVIDFVLNVCKSTECTCGIDFVLNVCKSTEGTCGIVYYRMCVSIQSAHVAPRI